MWLIKKANISKKLRWFAGKRSYKWVVRDWLIIQDLELCSKVLTTDRFRKDLETLVVDAPGEGKRILVIAPHPDDETIGAGGTLLMSAERGAKITCLYVTNGASASEEIYPDVMSKMREDEAKEVWGRIGGDTIFLRFPDRHTPLSPEAASTLADAINNIMPDIIFIPFLLDDHDEHRRSNNLFWLAKDIVKKKNIDIWAYQVWSGLLPNVAVNISDVIDKKGDINRLWRSQNLLRDFVHYSRSLSGYNSKYVMTNEASYFEIFFVVPMKEYLELCQLYFGTQI